MIMSGKKPYYPNNWREWKEVPDEFLYAPTFEEFQDWKLHGWQLPSSVFCIIRETKPSGKIKEYTEGETVLIPQGIKHRIENKATKKIVFIEVQTGSYFGEDDIVRIEDDYNRI